MKRHVFFMAACAVIAASLGFTQAAVPGPPAAAIDAIFCALDGVHAGMRGRRRASTASPSSSAPTAWPTSSATSRTRRTRSSKRDRSRSSSRPRPCSCWRATASCRSTIRSASTFPSFPTTARRSRSVTCSRTPAGCATGERSRASPAGRATTRAHTHAHVLDIVSRQKALNFTPGTNWSYSNTGYNLSAIIVARVSGQSFADFSRDRIFKPLGMTRTSWRDDYTRIVKHRAIAYEPPADGYREDMPFENVHGNGGLLTTVGDLLRWNENFVSPIVGDAGLRRGAADPGTLHRRARSRLRLRALRRACTAACARSVTAARRPATARSCALSRISTSRSPCCATPATRTRRSTRTPSREAYLGRGLSPRRRRGAGGGGRGGAPSAAVSRPAAE